MKKVNIHIITFFLLFPLFTFSQKVENVRFEQVGKQIHIYYDLQGAETYNNIKVFCSIDDGQSWGEPLQKVTGAVGNNQLPGTNKKIAWDVLTEREKLVGEIRFKIEYYLTQVPEKAMEQPIKYTTPQEDVLLTKDEKRRPGSCWIVYSDKNGNKTYESSTNNKLKRTIGFMDAFYVEDETNKRVHLFKDPDYKEGFSSSVEDYGWIDKENLLLWDHCLITKTGKINLKAMVLNTIESLKKDKINERNKEKIKYYYNDQLTIKTSRSFKFDEILFIYKIKDGAMLLGKNYITDAYHAKEEIFGWVSAKKITIWGHRIAIEPNWDKEATLERKQKNVRTTFFIDAYEAKRYSEGGALNKKSIIWDQ